ncbi:MAG TPA: hypothetical protein PK280_12090 [Planctomycetota bacterium]|nr:hypothetical protein [Planctomycetota bacterium]
MTPTRNLSLGLAAIAWLAVSNVCAGETAPDKDRQAKSEAPPAAAQPAQPAAQPAQPTRQTRGIGDLEQTPASQVIAMVAEHAGVNIVIDPECVERMKTPLSFRTRGMTCRQVLDWTVRLTGTCWVLTDGVILVLPREKMPKQTDPIEAVRKIIAEHPEFNREPPVFEPAPEMALPVRK